MSADLWFLDEICDAVNSPGTADPELLREASMAYSEACRTANVRLRDVDRLLKNGFRSEAIQLAEQEPILFDLVAELDFSLLEEWQGMLAQWNMQLPPQLERDISARLNTAYAELQPLEHLMRQHRLLALARAPLPARIEVLRKINSKDTINLSWQADLVAYERQRLQQIRGEASEASRRNELSILNELRNEVNNSEWISAVPQEVSSEVNSLYRSAEALNARESLKSLANELDKSYSEFDVARATALAGRWAELSQIAKLASNDPLVHQANPALEWVREQQQASANQQAFQAGLASLEAALERQTSATQLETLFRKAERFDLAIPDRLRNRVSDRLDMLRLQSRRRGMLIGAVASICVLIATAGVFMYWRTIHNRDLVAQHVEGLTKLIEEKQWTQADSYYQKLPASLQQLPQLIALHTRSANAITEEGEQAKLVAALLERAEQLDPANPDEELLRQIRGIANTADDKRRLAEIELAVRRKRQERQATFDKAFLATVSQWTDKIADLEKRENVDSKDLWSSLSELRSDLNQHAQATSSLRDRAEPLANRLRGIIDQREKVAGERTALKEIVNAVGKPDAYLAAIEKLIKAQPNTTAAAHARQILDDKEAWQTVMNWSKFWDAQRSNWKAMSSQQAAEVLKTGDELLSANAKNGLAKEYEDRKEYLAGIVARKDVDLSKLKSLMLQNSLASGVWLVIDAQGKCYYCPKSPTKDEAHKQLRFEFFSDATNRSEVTRTLQSIKAWVESPQSLLAKQTAKELASLNDENWDRTFFHLSESVRTSVESDPPLDAVLATDMLRQILKAGSDGSFRFKQAFANVNQELENSGVDLSVAWFVPGDKDAETARSDARALITGLSDFKTLVQSTRQMQVAHCDLPSQQTNWVAVLDKGQDETWTCQPPLDPSANGSLQVAVKSPAGEVTLAPVAEVNGGKVNWGTGSETSLRLLGMPVFLTRKSTSSP